VLDLTDRHVREALDVDEQDLVGEDYQRCQLLADAARAAVLDGVLPPSAGLPGQQSLVVFTGPLDSGRGHHRDRTRAVRRRWERAPAVAAARGHVGNRRLHQRWQGFIDRKKTPVIANAAIARELAGWCWSLAVLET